MSYVAIWLQACLHWRCAYFQTLSWNDTIFVVDWDILYKLCGSANKWSKGFVFSSKIWWQFFSCNKVCSKYHTCSTTTPKYTLTGRLVSLFKSLVNRANMKRPQSKQAKNFLQLRPNKQTLRSVWVHYITIVEILSLWRVALKSYQISQHCHL